MTQMTAWKKQLMGKVAKLFANGRQRRADQATEEQDLYEQIGRQKIEMACLGDPALHRVRVCCRRARRS